MSSMMKKMAVLAAAVALMLGATFGGLGLRSAEAGIYPTVVFPTFTGSISTEAVIATAASGTHYTIHAMQVASSGAGVVVFKDGTTGTTIANVYLAANTPTLIGQDVFGAAGLKCSATDRTITATLSGATLTILMRCDQQ
jgi:hypothetical protein